MIRCLLASCLTCLIVVPTMAQPPRPAAPPALEDLSPEAIRSKIEELARSPEGREQAAEILTRLLDSRRPEIQWRAARAIARMGVSTPSTPARLQNLIKNSENTAVRVHSIRALEAIGDTSDASVDAIMTAVTAADSHIAHAAIQALRDLELPPERVVAGLSKALASDNQATAQFAVEAIAESGAAATPLLIEALKTETSVYWAALAITEIGPDAAGAVPALAAALELDTDPQAQAEVCLALAKIGPPAKSATAALCKIITESEHSSVRMAGSYALGAIGATDCEEALATCANCDEQFVAMVGTWALAKTTGDAEIVTSAVEKLVVGLTSDDESMRNAAAQGLLQLAAPPEVVAPILMDAANSATAQQRSNLVSAIGSLGSDVVPKIITSLDREADSQKLALEIVAYIGPDAAPAVPKLLELLASADDDMRPRLHVALGRIGAPSAAATETIVAALDADDPAVRHTALFALRGIGPAAKSAVPALMKMSTASDDELDILGSIWALARIAPNDASVVSAITPTLEKGLKSLDEFHRVQSVKAAADLGSAAAPLQEALAGIAAADPSDQARSAALEVLQDLQ